MINIDKEQHCLRFRGSNAELLADFKILNIEFAKRYPEMYAAVIMTSEHEASQAIQSSDTDILAALINALVQYEKERK